MHPISPARRWSPFGLAALTALVIALLAAASASAAASVDRQILVDDVEIEHTSNECTGAEGTFSRTFRGFIQTVARPDGTTLFRGVIRADDATFVPDDPTQPTFTGSEEVHVSTISNRSSATSTFVLRFRATGSDGSRAMFKEVEHFTVSATGHTVEFERPVVLC